MGWEQWLAFISASLVLFLIPGPDMFLVAGWSASKGFKAGFKASLGTVSGILVHTFATALGLAALLATSATAFAVVKYVGAIYLLYLGVMTLKKSDASKFALSSERAEPNPFLQALLTNVLNPKVVLFFLAFLPQFIDPGRNATSQLLTLGISFALLSASCYLVLIFLACKAGQKVGDNEKVQTAVRWLGGTVLIGFGLRLALVSRS